MKNPFEAINNPKKSPEAALIYGEKYAFTDLVTKTIPQAERALADVGLVENLLSHGLKGSVLNARDEEEQKAEALAFAGEHPEVVPDTLEDDETGTAAYIVALAEVLKRPPYQN